MRIDDPQDLYTKPIDEIARTLDRRCPFCGVLKVPEIREVAIGDVVKKWPFFGPCVCPAAQEHARNAPYRDRLRKDREEAERVAIRLRMAGLGERLNATFATFQEREDWKGSAQVLTKAIKFWDAVKSGKTDGKPWLVMHGEYGTGKTHLAMAIVNAAVRHGMNAQFTGWVEYLDRVRATYDREAQERTETVERLFRDAYLLAIDDLDKTRPKEFAQERLYGILNYRYSERLPTVLTFNTSPTAIDPTAPGRLALADYITAPLMDRVLEMAWAIVDFDGPSFRSGLKWGTP